MADRKWTCFEENCLENVRDFTRVALQSMTGSMVVEVPLCELHIATLEMSNSGTYLFLRPGAEGEYFHRRTETPDD